MLRKRRGKLIPLRKSKDVVKGTHTKDDVLPKPRDTASQSRISEERPSAYEGSEDDSESEQIDKMPPFSRKSEFFAQSAGNFVERFETQFGIIVLVALDILSSTYEILLDSNSLPRNAFTDLLGEFLRRFTSFTLFFSILELGVLLFAFQQAFLVHAGYMLDSVIVAVLLYSDISNASKAYRMLQLFRLWRAVRLVNTIVSSVEEKYEGAVSELEQQKQTLELAKVERERIEEKLRREIEAKKQTESLLAAYKDEVETLTEALNIAAVTVAEDHIARYPDLTEEDEVAAAVLTDIEEELDNMPEESHAQNPTKAPSKRRIVIAPDGSFTTTSSVAPAVGKPLSNAA